jgi:hypothetical protein
VRVYVERIGVGVIFVQPVEFVERNRRPVDSLAT